MSAKLLSILFMTLLAFHAFSKTESIKKLSKDKFNKRETRFTIELELEYEMPASNSKREDKFETSLSPGYYLNPNYLVLLDFEFEQNHKRDNKLELGQVELRNLYFQKTKYINFNFELGIGLPQQDNRYSLNPLIRTTLQKSFLNIKPFHRISLRRQYYKIHDEKLDKFQMENQLGLIYFYNKKLSFGVAQSFFYKWDHQGKRRIAAAFDQSLVYQFSDLAQLEIGHEYYRPWRYRNGERTPFKLHSNKDSEYYMELQVRY